MTRKNDTLSTDEKLAQITDQYLDEGIKEISESSAELKGLTETVQSLYNAFDEEIDAKKAEEIRKKVTTNWPHIPKTTKNTQDKRIKWLSWTYRRRISMVTSLAIILIIIVLTPAIFTNVPTVTGSAGLFSQKTLFYSITGLILAAILIWILRKK